MNNECNQKHRLTAIEKDIKELKEADQCHVKDISTLKESNAETRVYVKQILERIEDLRDMFNNTKKTLKEKSESNDSLWAKHAAELVKLVLAIATILAGVKYFKL